MRLFFGGFTKMTSQEKVAMAVIHVKAEIIAWALPQIARELMGKGVMQ